MDDDAAEEPARPKGQADYFDELLEPHPRHLFGHRSYVPEGAGYHTHAASDQSDQGRADS